MPYIRTNFTTLSGQPYWFVMRSYTGSVRSSSSRNMTLGFGSKATSGSQISPKPRFQVTSYCEALREAASVSRTYALAGVHVKSVTGYFRARTYWGKVVSPTQPSGEVTVSETS